MALMPLFVVMALLAVASSRPLDSGGDGTGKVPMATVVPVMVPIKHSEDPRFANLMTADSVSINVVRDGLKHGVSVADSGYMVKSTSFEDVYFVAARVTRGESKSEWGVWAVGRDNSLILCADEVSKSYSYYLRGDETKEGVWADKDSEGRNLKMYVHDQE